MQRKFFIIGVFSLVAIVSFIFFSSQQKQILPKAEKSLTPISLSLDWTPNTNHTGIYVALSKGWYKDEGVDLTILPYSSSVTPDVLVSSGRADLGISFAEGVVADIALKQPVISVAAIVQHNTSSLVVLEDSGITRPSMLSGKVYGGFGSPWEESIVNAVIEKDGGEGNIKNVILDTSAMEALVNGQIDAVWIYEGWEGVQAAREGIKLTSFPLIEYGIPDYYTPVIITSPKTLSEKEASLKRFMRATLKGYEYARKYPKLAAQALIDQAPKGTFPDEALVFESQEYLSGRYADKGRKWGLQDEKMWKEYPEFLLTAKAIADVSGNPIDSIDFASLYTNKLLQ